MRSDWVLTVDAVPLQEGAEPPAPPALRGPRADQELVFARHRVPLPASPTPGLQSHDKGRSAVSGAVRAPGFPLGQPATALRAPLRLLVGGGSFRAALATGVFHSRDVPSRVPRPLSRGVWRKTRGTLRGAGRSGPPEDSSGAAGPPRRPREPSDDGGFRRGLAAGGQTAGGAGRLPDLHSAARSPSHLPRPGPPRPPLPRPLQYLRPSQPAPGLPPAPRPKARAAPPFPPLADARRVAPGWG